MNIKSIKNEIHRRYHKDYGKSAPSGRKRKYLPIAYRVWDEVDVRVEEIRVRIWWAAK
jgi:hypothetical protein